DHDLIHGNIKPTNIFIATDGRVLLSDFGIARGYDDSQQSLTRVGWGSAEYAAPEQSLGVLRRSSDIYASGVLLFRVLAGQPPFVGRPQTPPPAYIHFASLFTPLSSPEPLSPAFSLGTPRVSGNEDFGSFSAAPTTQPLTGNFPYNPQPSRGSENFGTHSNF